MRVLDGFRELGADDDKIVDEHLIPAGRVSLRTLAVFVPTMLASGALAGLMVRGLGGEAGPDDPLPSVGQSLQFGLAVGGVSLLIFVLPVVVTVLAARGKMAHSRTVARVVVAVLVAVLWGLVLLIAWGILGSATGQFLGLIWPSLLLTIVVGVALAPWLVAPRLEPEPVAQPAPRPGRTRRPRR